MKNESTHKIHQKYCIENRCFKGKPIKVQFITMNARNSLFVLTLLFSMAICFHSNFQPKQIFIKLFASTWDLTNQDIRDTRTHIYLALFSSKMLILTNVKWQLKMIGVIPRPKQNLPRNYKNTSQ